MFNHNGTILSMTQNIKYRICKTSQKKIKTANELYLLSIIWLNDMTSSCFCTCVTVIVNSFHYSRTLFKAKVKGPPRILQNANNGHKEQVSHFPKPNLSANLGISYQLALKCISLPPRDKSCATQARHKFLRNHLSTRCHSPALSDHYVIA